MGQGESKVAKEKLVKTLELCQFVVKHIRQQVGEIKVKKWSSNQKKIIFI